MALRDDVESAFERVKAKLKEDQGYTTSPNQVARKVVSRSVMPFEYANGRIMFDAAKTRELVLNYAVHGSIQSVVSAIATEMRELGFPQTFTVGYVRNPDMNYVFTFVYLQG